MRRWGWGAAGSAGLVAAACASVALGLVPGIPLFDGLAPPPLYRWVNPPAPLRGENVAPAPVTATFPLSAAGSPDETVLTPDGQAQLLMPAGAIPPAAGQGDVSIAISPLDPAQVPATPPGFAIQGNAYRIDVRYEPSGATATAVMPVQVQLAYPVDGTQVILDAGSGWQVLPDRVLEAAYLEVAASTTTFGTFAVALTGVAPERPSRIPPWVYAIAGIALLAAAAPVFARRQGPAP